MSLTREAELALLIADQEADDTPYVQQRAVSLDKAFDDSDAASGTLLDVICRDLWGDSLGLSESEESETSQISTDTLFYWKYLRNKHHWTYSRIAATAGVSASTVSRRVAQPYHLDGTCFATLAERFDVLVHAYERGARLRDIADAIYAECGYKTPGSCYVSLHVLFSERRVKMRPPRWRHGMRSVTADPQVARDYRNAKNAELRARGFSSSGNPLRRCAAKTRFGRSCRRHAIRESPYCVVHAQPHPTQKWTCENVCDALSKWETQHGSGPTADQWRHATADHPSTGTVYALFGSWLAALEAADVVPAKPRRSRSSDGRFVVSP